MKRTAFSYSPRRIAAPTLQLSNIRVDAQEIVGCTKVAAEYSTAVQHEVAAWASKHPNSPCRGVAATLQLSNTRLDTQDCWLCNVRSDLFFCDCYSACGCSLIKRVACFRLPQSCQHQKP